MTRRGSSRLAEMSARPVAWSQRNKRPPVSLWKLTIAARNIASPDGRTQGPASRTLRACMSPARHRDDAHTLAESRCAGQDGALINSAAAAHLLGLSRRQTQRLAAPSHARPCVRPRARSQRRLGVDVVVCGALRGCYVP